MARRADVPLAQVGAGSMSFYSSTGPIRPTGPSERGRASDVGRSRQSVGRFARAVGRTGHRRHACALRRVVPFAAGGAIALHNVSVEGLLTWPAEDPRARRRRASWMSSPRTSNRAGRSRTRRTWLASGRAPRSARGGQKPGFATVRILECVDAVPPRPDRSVALPSPCRPP